MIVYLTFNDSPSGIYNSQVIDVCRFYTDELKKPVKLISFISIRGFKGNKIKIKKKYKNSFVVPMIPKMRNWKWNKIIFVVLCFFIRPSVIIARGPFATNIAFSVKRKNRKIVFDARGAYTAELNEYNVVHDQRIKNAIELIERNALSTSDCRLAVSEALVSYWKERFNFHSPDYVIIPCTIEGANHKIELSENQISESRKMLNIQDDDILLVYSGSSAGWQSFELLSDFIERVMTANSKVKLLLLVKNIPDNFKAYGKFKDRIICKWVLPEEISKALIACDYGLLLRERSVTNKVSSPTKFAEYLSSGLKVLISEEIGDYSNFVKDNDCGSIIDTSLSTFVFEKISLEKKKELIRLADDNFSKQIFKEEYLKLIK